MYGVPAYFCGKVTSEMPNFIIIPGLMSLICYFALHLNLLDASHFFIFFFIGASLFAAGGGMGLLIGSAVSNK